MNWPALLAYVLMGTALIAGGVLGYRRGHRALTAFIGPALGFGLVIVANRMVSNDSISGSGDLSWRLIFAFVGAAVIFLYLVGFAVGVVADVLRRRIRASHEPRASH